MIPFPEYPRPALRRDSFLNLNGSWSYAITADEALPHAWDGEILVPYSPETAASGVRRTLQPNQWLHYQRMFTPPDGAGGDRKSTRLNSSHIEESRMPSSA